jgi:hypothetical protein
MKREVLKEKSQHPLAKSKNIWLSAYIKTNVFVIECSREDNITFKTEILETTSLPNTIQILSTFLMVV